MTQLPSLSQWLHESPSLANFSTARQRVPLQSGTW